MRDLTLHPEYAASHALIIGVNQYICAPPLQHAVSDARAIADVLERQFSFPPENVTLLLDGAGTKARILSAYLGYTTRASDPDSRLLIFFAGHGLTAVSRRQEVGFLVPCDGEMNDLSTLIRWDEFTRNADLIPAKHIFLIMDACYGGLIFNRSAMPGGLRFLKDILRRPVRQALTAGKEDEPVADGGGPRRDHSIFTGHLLNALEGAARAPEGHLTASGVMSYVYQQVSNDIHSAQTPHFGFLSGDGDFIFDAPQLGHIPESDKEDEDILVSIPSSPMPESLEPAKDMVSITKALLSDPQGSIRLHDLLTRSVRTMIAEMSQRTAVAGPAGKDDVAGHLQSSESRTRDLRGVISAIAHWGGGGQETLLAKCYSRIGEALRVGSADSISAPLQWYPAMLLAYVGGISALASGRHGNLRAILCAPVSSPKQGSGISEFGEALSEGILALERSGIFKQLPVHERYYTPRSEYLFKLLQPELDDELFLGKEYEALFDKFEIVLALKSAQGRKLRDGHTWGPIGRFGWKQTSWGGAGRPLAELVDEIQAMREQWPPFQAGLYGRDFAAFADVVSEYAAYISRLPWR